MTEGNEPGSGTGPEGDPWELLRSLPPGSEFELIRVGGTRVRGTLVPSHGLVSERVVQVKLASGYNVGLRILPTDRATVLDRPPVEPVAPGRATPGPEAVPRAPGEGWIAVLSTGGTIASRVDYRTGGVRPVREEAEILAFYPDLDRDGPVRVVSVLDRLSEEITPTDWILLAHRVAETFGAGASGVVVAHGTDTLAYTAAALSFALPRLPGPVVLVGAQRSPDRPSSDGPSNLLAAVRLARSGDLGEVVVVMHSGLSDTEFAIHRGSRVRKMHTSRRDAFRTRNGPPLGTISDGTISWNSSPRPPSTGPPVLDDRFDPRGGLLWLYPGLEPERAEGFVRGHRGVVLSGTGLGHASLVHLPWIRRAVTDGTFVGMSSQCLEGAVDPFVYATGRELVRAGVTYLGDMLAEVAYAKLLFALGRARGPGEVAEEMLRDWSGELSDRRPVGDAG